MEHKSTLARLEFLKERYEMLPAYQESRAALDDVYMYIRINGPGAEFAKLPFWKVLIADLLAKVDIWQRDKNGEIKRGENGLPKLNIVKLMFNLGKVLSYVLMLIKESDALGKGLHQI